MERVIVNDVGPRDGLQNDPVMLAPDQRVQLINALLDAGLPAVEAVSFVSPKAVPKMAGAAEVVAGLDLDAADFSALVPNQKGYELAKASGVRAIGVVLSATDTMNRENINMTLEETRAVCRDIVGQAKHDGVLPRAYISVAVECPFEGLVPIGCVHELVDEMFAAGAAEVIIADTIGAANPHQVKELFNALNQSHAPTSLAAHFHDTRAMALANTWAALECDIRKFDASIGGLGGCPFAPGAAGNLATEDLVMLLHQAGFATGIDETKLLGVVDLVGEFVGRAVGGRSLPWQRKRQAKQELKDGSRV